MGVDFKINKSNLVSSSKKYRRGHCLNSLVTSVPDHGQIRIRISFRRLEKHTNNQTSYIQSYTVAPVVKINESNLVSSSKKYGREHRLNSLVTSVPDHGQIRIRISFGRLEKHANIQTSYIQSYTVAPVIKINELNLVSSSKKYERGHPLNSLVTSVPDYHQIRIRISLGRLEKHTNIIYLELHSGTRF